MSKPNRLAGSLFCLSLIGFAVLMEARLSGGEVGLLTSLALLAWVLDYRAVSCEPVDFSSSKAVYLAVALMGQGGMALMMLLSGALLRVARGKKRILDLFYAGLAIAALTLLQWGGLWPQGAPARFAFGILAVGAAMGLESIHRRQMMITRTDIFPEWMRGEREMNLFRVGAGSLGLSGAFLELEQALALVLLGPLCLSVHRAVENTAFRLHAKEATRAKHAAAEAVEELEETRDRLKDTAIRGRVLEELTLSMSRAETRQEAFRSLVGAARQVSPFRSMVLFAEGPDGLTPVFSETPEPDRLDEMRRLGYREPTVEKSHQLRKAVRARAPEPDKRLLETEGEVLAIPLGPNGVLYFGQHEQPFQAAEIKKLIFLCKRASPVLEKTTRSARTREALLEETRASRALRDQVRLMAQLLRGSEALTRALTEDQVYQALEEIMMSAVDHRVGCVYRDGKILRQWPKSQVLPDLLDWPATVLKQSGLMIVRDPSSAPSFRQLLGVPLLLTEGPPAVLLLFGESSEDPATEEQDFIATAAHLAGSSLTVTTLFDQLKHAHQQVVQASKLSAVGRLAAGVAHELNTPLAAIGLALEAALRRPEKAGKKLERANSALEKARHIITQLLDYSRQGEGERQLVELSAVIEGALELAGAQLRKRNRLLRLEVAEGLDPVLADLTELQQILINLLINAADATEKGEEIVVFAHQHESVVVLGVKDHGRGIANEHQSKIFDPFFTTKEVGRGTGLGLSVCQQLAERHQGHISFESRPGETVFRLELPARRPQEL